MKNFAMLLLGSLLVAQSALAENLYVERARVVGVDVVRAVNEGRRQGLMLNITVRGSCTDRVGTEIFSVSQGPRSELVPGKGIVTTPAPSPMVEALNVYFISDGAATASAACERSVEYFWIVRPWNFEEGIERHQLQVLVYSADSRVREPKTMFTASAIVNEQGQVAVAESLSR